MTRRGLVDTVDVVMYDVYATCHRDEELVRRGHERCNWKQVEEGGNETREINRTSSQARWLPARTPEP